MKLLKYTIIIFIMSIAFPTALYGIVPVVVLDAEKLPIAGATVLLVREQDSTIVDAKITDSYGHVDFQYKHDANLAILVKCIGYEFYRTPYVHSLDTIYLKGNSTELSEVTVTAHPQALKRKSERFVFTPGELRNEVTTSYDLIKMTPLLQINNDSFSILGKGNSRIFINGRDPQMESTALIEMLKAQPAGQIKRVEIITSPGSLYSASTSGGIINVVMDNPTQGFVGSSSVVGRLYNERISPSVSLWTGYSYDNLNLAISMVYNGDNINDSNSDIYQYTGMNQYVQNDTHISGWSNIISGRINASYDLTSMSSVGFAVNINDGQSHQTSKIKSVSLTQSVETASKATIKTVRPWHRPNIGVQAYYTLRTDDKGSNLDVIADYTANIANTRSEYNWDSAIEYQNTDVNSNGVHFKPQYRYVISEKQSLDVGYDLFCSKVDNDYYAAANSNRFLYKEMINSGYVNWNANWSTAFSTSFGLRVENSDIEGSQYINSETFKNSYTDFFPSFSCSLDLPWRGNQNISFDVTRYIFRPYYSSLNPFVYRTSETTCTKGNIDLHPSYEWDFSIYYSFLNDFVLGVSYGTVNNTLLDYTYREGGKTVSSTRNFGNSKSFNSFISFNRVYGGFWRVKTSGTINYDKYEAWLDNINLGTHSFNFAFNLQNNIILSRSKTIRLLIDYALYSPIRTITNDGKYKNLLSMSITKMFRNGITVSMEAFNLLGFKNDGHFNSAEYSYQQNTLMYPAQVSIKVNYRFGKRRVTGANDRYKSALDSRFN